MEYYVRIDRLFAFHVICRTCRLDYTIVSTHIVTMARYSMKHYRRIDSSRYAISERNDWNLLLIMIILDSSNIQDKR
jgi:hypothetical protein